MKLKQPILFHSLKELQEAVEYKIVSEKQYKLYNKGKYSFPTLFWDRGEQFLRHQNDNKILLDSYDIYLPILRKSVDWKDTREQYKPKEWYELESSIDKPVWVKDFKTDAWELTQFKKYDKSDEYPYVDFIDSTWKYAKPVIEKDLIHEI